MPVRRKKRIRKLAGSQLLSTANQPSSSSADLSSAPLPFTLEEAEDDPLYYQWQVSPKRCEY